MYSYGPPHMAVQKQDDQHEHTFSYYVRIRDVVLKTCLRRWTIGRSGERGSGISVLPARHDDEDIIPVLKQLTRFLLRRQWSVSYSTSLFNSAYLFWRPLFLTPKSTGLPTTGNTPNACLTLLYLFSYSLRRPAQRLTLNPSLY